MELEQKIQNEKTLDMKAKALNMGKKYTFTIETEDVGDRVGRTFKVVARYGNYSHAFPVLFQEELAELKNTIEDFLKNEQKEQSYGDR